MNDQAILAMLRMRIAAIGDAGLSVSAPLFYEDRPGRLRFLASAVFLAVADCRFLITAGHAIDEAARKPLYAGGEEELVQVGTRGDEWRQSIPPNADRDDDKVDLAVLRLAQHEVAALGVGFVELSQLNPGYQPVLEPVVGTYYVCVGFPKGRQSTWLRDGALVPRQMYLALRPGPPLAGIGSGYSDAWNLAAEFNREDGLNQDGQSVLLPDPVGMSGGGMWAVDRLVTDSPAEPRLVAIGTAWNKRANVIIGTRIGLVLDAIADLEPRLAEHMPWPNGPPP